jgi:hypothetical protein
MPARRCSNVDATLDDLMAARPDTRTSQLAARQQGRRPGLDRISSAESLSERFAPVSVRQAAAEVAKNDPLTMGERSRDRGERPDAWLRPTIAS